MNRKRAILVVTISALTVVNFRGRRYWVHHINKKRSKHGEFASMFKQLVKYPERFHSYFRMTKEQFYALLNLIKSKIQPRICKFRKPISAIEKLVVTLK